MYPTTANSDPYLMHIVKIVHWIMRIQEGNLDLDRPETQFKRVSAMFEGSCVSVRHESRIV